RLVADRVAPGLEVVLLEDVLHRRRHLHRLRAAGTLQRQVGRDDELRRTAPLVIDAGAGRRRERLRGPATATAFLASPAAAGGRECEGAEQHDEDSYLEAFCHSILLRRPVMARPCCCDRAVSGFRRGFCKPERSIAAPELAVVAERCNAEGGN